MKILFYDGPLYMYFFKTDTKDASVLTVDAADGPKANTKLLNQLDGYEKSNDLRVITNSLIALSHYYGWDKEENHTDIYLWVDEIGAFVRIDKLTNREIRYAQCIEKMYLNGVFDIDFNQISIDDLLSKKEFRDPKMLK